MNFIFLYISLLYIFMYILFSYFCSSRDDTFLHLSFLRQRSEILLHSFWECYALNSSDGPVIQNVVLPKVV